MDMDGPVVARVVRDDETGDSNTIFYNVHSHQTGIPPLKRWIHLA